MSASQPNLDLAEFSLEELARVGVREVCICAGARNSPLVFALDSMEGVRKYPFFEERSAGFFAVGRMLESGSPVAIITTSGTAAAELLPAMIEAYYQGLPLIAVTADRPRRYRGTGAPQSIEQVNLFGPYATASVDLAAGDAYGLTNWNGVSPAHVNLCFDEPLLDGKLAPREFPVAARPRPARWTTDPYAVLGEFLDRCVNPLVVVGALPAEARAGVRRYLLELGSPIYAEALSGLREDPALADQLLRAGERNLSIPHVREGFDSVLRIGGVPTVRLWRDLEGALADLPLLSISELPFSGSPRSQLIQVPLAEFFADVPPQAQIRPSRPDHGKREKMRKRFLELDRARASQLEDLLAAEPRSEPGMVRRFSRLVPDEARLYLGNSLPIREWDLAADRRARGLTFGASRGANGIDGQISTFLGFAQEKAENWALIGDLTALYDLAGPWALRQRPGLRAVLGILNNGGGQIFNRIFPHPAFENAHALGFADWAKMWGLRYECWDEVPEPHPDLIGRSATCVIELNPDPEATARFWQAHDRAME